MRQFDEIKEQYLRWCKSWYAWAIEKQLYVIGQLIEAHTYVCDHHEKAKVDIAAMQIEIKELQAQLAEANERADKAAQDGWLKTAETQLARAKKAEAQLAEAREYVNSIDSNTEWIFDVKDCLQAILK